MYHSHGVSVWNSTTESYMVSSRQFVVHDNTENWQSGYALDVRTRQWWRSLSSCQEANCCHDIYLRLVLIERCPQTDVCRCWITYVLCTCPCWTSDRPGLHHLHLFYHPKRAKYWVSPRLTGAMVPPAEAPSAYSSSCPAFISAAPMEVVVWGRYDRSAERRLC